ncbi:MAG: YceI family protein [Sphingobacteriales bacterium]|nr:YceI family protein [Sphingobacteriales bacterium]
MLQKSIQQEIGDQVANCRFDAKSIKSLKENGNYYDEGMDKNTYKALNVEVYPEIVFTLKNISNVKTVGNTSNLTVQGNLTVAGKTKTLSFPGKAIVNGNNITFTCSTKFKMTLFDIQPPTALFGTIKTGDEITLDINSTFTKL